jgi:hypothetical protein
MPTANRGEGDEFQGHRHLGTVTKKLTDAFFECVRKKLEA